MSKPLFIHNGIIITPYRYIRGGNIQIAEGRIVEVREEDADPYPGSDILDAGGHFIAPGFIDIHVHGGGGADFMDATTEAFQMITRTHARYGTTSLYPTTLTASKEQMMEVLSVHGKLIRSGNEGARLMGLHLEGPYFAMAQRGAQDPKYIRNPLPEEYETILTYRDQIARWSAAPELPGAAAFARALLKAGILPALAHTDGIYEDVIRGFENGYTLATHLYSGMSGVTRKNAFRYAGVIESALLIDEMDVEVIADGVHLPAPLLQLIHQTKGSSRIALITDAIRAAGLPPGPSVIGSLTEGLPVIVEDEVAKLPDRSSFAGSVATADRLIRTMTQIAGLPLIDAVRMMTSTPARIMRSASKGTIAADRDADLVIFNKQVEVQYTIVEGRIVYQSGA